MPRHRDGNYLTICGKSTAPSKAFCSTQHQQRSSSNKSVSSSNTKHSAKHQTSSNSTEHEQTRWSLSGATTAKSTASSLRRLSQTGSDSLPRGTTTSSGGWSSAMQQRAPTTSSGSWTAHGKSTKTSPRHQTTTTTQTTSCFLIELFSAQRAPRVPRQRPKQKEIHHKSAPSTQQDTAPQRIN